MKHSPRLAAPPSARMLAAGAALVGVVVLVSCSTPDAARQPGRVDAGSPSASATANSEPTLTPTPASLPTASRRVAGTRAASAVLSRSDVKPTGGFLSENGNLLVWWELEGVRDRDAFRCRYPVVVTWVPHRGWAHGVKTGMVHAWLLADGIRDLPAPTRNGFYLGRSQCSGRDPHDQSPGLLVDQRGQLRRIRVSPAAEAPRQGAVSTACSPPLRGSCQVDPETASMMRLPGPYSWDGTWRARSSILWRASGHISGTWSVDGGSTWNQFIDTWDATPVRRGDGTVAVSNGVRSSFGRLTGGSLRQGMSRHGYNYIEWDPRDAAPMTPLPRSVDGYRSWHRTPSGILVGLAARPAGVYVSAGRNWRALSRRTTGPCRSEVLLVGRYLVCANQPNPPLVSAGQPLRRRPPGPLGLGVSQDLGATWATIPLDAVTPPTIQ